MRVVDDGYHETLEGAARSGDGVTVHVPGERLRATVVIVSETDVLLETEDGPRFVPLAHIGRVSRAGAGRSPSPRHL